VVVAFVRSVLAEPRAPDPPVRVWWDWALVGALLATAVAEAVFRPDVPWRPLATVVALLVIPVLLWRRTHPLLATAVGWGGAMVLHIPMILDDVVDVGLYSMVGIVLLPYALYRWASGPEALVGTAVVAVPAGLGFATSATLEDVIGGATLLVAVFALGAAMRYRAVAHQREVQQARTHERGGLARELHDTVAHHVSAIAIQAQAGRAVAATDPASALEALAVIEAEASRTLHEMRTMVRVLRDGEAADAEPVEFGPQRGISDLDELTRMSPVV
jgi:signal transduction histidine kinase